MENNIVLHWWNPNVKLDKCSVNCNRHFNFQYFRVAFPKLKTDNYPILESTLVV